VQNYIKDILLNCATFDLEKLQKISTRKEINEGDIYYEKNSNPPVYHLIFANEGSEAGKYYNNYSLQYIEDTYKFLRDLKSFDIIKTVKDRFKEVAKDIIEKTEKELKFDNNINNSDNSNNKIIKLYQPENIILKKCFMDELGFSNFKANGLEPKYNYYKKDDQIIIRIELPGNCYIESSKDYIGKYTVIKINGIKSKDKEPEEIEQNIFNTRENGNFYLEILLKTEEYLIKNEEPKIEEKKGIFILSYKLDEKTDKVSKYKLKEEEEI
jgi:HSP20 family molecular chaperone IbpA